MIESLRQEPSEEPSPRGYPKQPADLVDDLALLSVANRLEL